MSNRTPLCLVIAAIILSIDPISSTAGKLEDAVTTLANVEPGASGHEKATAALRTVEAAGPKALVPLAEQIGNGNALADNWLRGAFEVIADDGFDSVQDDLLEFYANRDHNARARRLVFETLTASDKELKRDLLAKALDDPSEEMRFDAVATLLETVEEADSDQQKEQILSAALKAATVRAQVNNIAEQLEMFGSDVNKQSHFGFLTKWHAIGPFDNKDMSGFNVEYGPERADLSAPDLRDTFEGMLGEAKWQELSTDKDDGIVDLAEQLAPHKGALVYVTTNFESQGERPVELRLSTANAWKMWLNGQPLFEREEYHRGLHWDQYRIPATLGDGTNTIVIKVLQNEQEQSWAQRWSYSLRITDLSGRGLTSLASN